MINPTFNGFLCDAAIDSIVSYIIEGYKRVDMMDYPCSDYIAASELGRRLKMADKEGRIFDIYVKINYIRVIYNKEGFRFLL